MAQKGYKIRSYANGATKSGKEYRNYSLTVPNEIAEQIPEGVTFALHMTDEGLLYVPTNQAESETELPAWAQTPQEAA